MCHLTRKELTAPLYLDRECAGRRFIAKWNFSFLSVTFSSHYWYTWEKKWVSNFQFNKKRCLQISEKFMWFWWFWSQGFDLRWIFLKPLTELNNSICRSLDLWLIRNFEFMGIFIFIGFHSFPTDCLINHFIHLNRK